MFLFLITLFFGSGDYIEKEFLTDHPLNARFDENGVYTVGYYDATIYFYEESLSWKYTISSVYPPRYSNKYLKIASFSDVGENIFAIGTNSIDIYPNFIGGEHYEGNYLYIFDKTGFLVKYTLDQANSDTEYVSSVSVSKNGKYVLATGWTGASKVWLVELGVGFFSMSVSSDAISGSVADDGHLVVGMQGKVTAFDETSSVWTKTVPFWAKVDISNDGRYVIAGSRDTADDIYLIDFSTGNTLWTYSLDSAVTSLDISDDGSFVCATTSNNTLYVFSNGGTLLFQDSGVKSVKISGNGEYFVISRSNKFEMYRMSDFTSVLSLDYTPISIDIMNDGSKVLFSDSSAIRIVRNPEKKILRIYALVGDYPIENVSVNVSSENIYLTSKTPAEFYLPSDNYTITIEEPESLTFVGWRDREDSSSTIVVSLSDDTSLYALYEGSQITIENTTYVLKFSVPRILGTPTPIYPYGTVTTNQIKFRWSGVSDATSYEIKIVNIDEGTENTFVASGTDTTIELSPASYYWKIRAIGGTDTLPSLWSDKKMFTVDYDVEELLYWYYGICAFDVSSENVVSVQVSIDETSVQTPFVETTIENYKEVGLIETQNFVSWDTGEKSATIRLSGENPASSALLNGDDDSIVIVSYNAKRKSITNISVYLDYSPIGKTPVGRVVSDDTHNVKIANNDLYGDGFSFWSDGVNLTERDVSPGTYIAIYGESRVPSEPVIVLSSSDISNYPSEPSDYTVWITVFALISLTFFASVIYRKVFKP